MYGYRGLGSLRAEIMIIFEVMMDGRTHIVTPNPLKNLSPKTHILDIADIACFGSQGAGHLAPRGAAQGQHLFIVFFIFPSLHQQCKMKILS